ncbi:MAG: ferrous iron transport protein B [Sumerlaeia bacterium]
MTALTPTPSEKKTFRVALIGNPNTGKTTLFNALTGFRARVGNYPGVTVETRTGALKGSNGAVQILDLPGTYSLSAHSPDELIAVEVLTGIHSVEAKPDLLAVVVDAANLERNLFLATQVMEIGLPTVIVLNMVDAAAEAGITVDGEKLAERLGVPVLPTSASKGKGVDAVATLLRGQSPPAPPATDHLFPPEFEREIDALAAVLRDADQNALAAEPVLLQRALLDQDGAAEERLADAAGEPVRTHLKEARQRLSDQGIRIRTVEARMRYGHIRGLLTDVVSRPEESKDSLSDKIDRILIHRVWGTLVFAVLMLIVFQAIYSWSAPLMDAIDAVFGALGDVVTAAMGEGPLRSLIVDGVIAGVGGVVIFLPQILILFAFIALLEDCGYMSRAAFLMDRLLSRCGLSGRSFIPMLSSFACAIPGIMATRTIEDRRDRLTTILVAPLMSCSARLPVYVLLIGAFIPERTLVPGVLGLQGTVLFCMYLVGFAFAVPVAMLLKRTLLKGKTPSFILELPSYKMPQWRTVIHRVLERGQAFLWRAGTVIFAVSVVVWALTYYPRPESVATETEAAYATEIAQAEAAAQSGDAEAQATLEETLARRDSAVEGALLRQSFLGRMGHAIEPIVKPIGWDWRIAMAVVASFPAREVVVATLGIIYDVGGDAAEDNPDLREKLRTAKDPQGNLIFNLPVALSLMVFFALCAQCAATLAIIRRETNSWRWPIFTFTYMTVLAYFAALVTYQVGMLFM